MELGSGLTLQTRTVGNKTTSGLFFMPATNQKNSKKKAANEAKTIPSRLGVQNKTQTTNKKILHEKVVRNASVKQGNPASANSRRNPKSSSVTTEGHSPNGMKENIPKSKQQQQRPQNKKYNANSNNSNNKTLQQQQHLVVDPSYVTLTQDQLNTILSLVKTKHEIDVSKVINVNKDDDCGRGTTSKPGSGTSVRSRLSKNSASSRRTTATNGGGVLGLLQAAGNNEVNVPALNLDDQESQLQVEGAGSAVENDAIQSPHQPANQIYTYSGTLMGLGSRDQDKEKLERNRKQWVEDLKDQMERKRVAKKDLKMANLNEHELNYFGHHQAPNSGRRSEIQEEISISTATTEPVATTTRIQVSDSHLHQANGNLPSAMRSSFFIGESGPRSNAFSAKKRQDQQRWREDLKQQMNEQKEKKASTKQRRHHQDTSLEDEDLWFRHFDTMQPQASRIESPRQQLPSPTTTQVMTNDHQQQQANNHQTVRDSDVDDSGGNNTGRSGVDGDGAPGNHLRKMTSLLDPAEKDAIKVRRQKQEEHRRAISEQVEERKRMKEEQERARMEEEEEEERKLNEDRINLQRQFEREKISQQQKEELRDKKTLELYQTMQESKAAALREKFEKRQKSLRRKGHDTTRLEQAHRTTLDTKPLNSDTSETNLMVVRPLNLKQVGITPVASHHKQDDDVRSGRVIQVTSDQHRNPIASATITEQSGGSGGPIRLEISLSNTNQGGNPSLNETKEISVQTDFNNAISRHHHDISIMSEAGTEYIPLPISRQGRQQPPYQQPQRNKSPRRKISNKDLNSDHQSRFDQNNLYDKYARQQQDGGVGKKEKPKWGVGPKKKQYKPASQKYVGGTQWKEKHDENMKRREEHLLAQQALNERHLLVGKSTTNKTSSSSSPTEKKSGGKQPSTNSYHRNNNNKKNSDTSNRRHHRDDQPSSTNHLSVESTDHHLRPSSHLRHKFDHLTFDQRPMSVTTQEAKYDASKHSRSSPVPDTTNDFVEYRRSDVILNPTTTQSRQPDSQHHISMYHHHGGMDGERPISSRKTSDPLIHGSVVKQNAKERQDRILKEISILRHGLLLKQREVASYPPVIPSTTTIGASTGSNHLNKNPAGDMTAISD